MSAEEHNNRYFWQAALPSPRERVAVEGCLAAGGFRLLLGGEPPAGAGIGAVSAAFAITRQMRETLEQLLARDSAEAMATALCVTAPAARKRLGHLEAEMGVHSQHRIVLRAVDYGLLRLVLQPGGSRFSLQSSPRPFVLQVTAPDAAARAAAERCLAAGEFPVRRRDPVVWEVAPDADDLPIRMTSKEREALTLLLAHDTAGPIAGAMGVGPEDVGFHLRNLKGKCRARLLRDAKEQLVLTPEITPAVLRAKLQQAQQSYAIRTRARLVAALMTLGVVRQRPPR